MTSSVNRKGDYATAPRQSSMASHGDSTLRVPKHPAWNDAMGETSLFKYPNMLDFEGKGTKLLEFNQQAE